jgi:hypothetical protein
LKSVVLITAIVAGCFIAAFGVLRVLHMAVNPDFPLATGAVAIVSALAGIFPLVRNRNTDPGTMLQKAMAGTMLHMLVAAALSVLVISLLPRAHRLDLIFWVLGGYWVSLLTVVWRSRQIIVKASAMFASTSSVTKAH